MWTFDTKDEALAHARTLNLRRNYGAIVYRSPSDRPLPLPGQVTSQPD